MERIELNDVPMIDGGKDLSLLRKQPYFGLGHRLLPYHLKYHHPYLDCVLALLLDVEAVVDVGEGASTKHRFDSESEGGQLAHPKSIILFN